MINIRKDLSRILDACKVDLSSKKYTIVVFGAGNTSILYQDCFTREGILPKYYVDNDPVKQGTLFCETEVISPNKLHKLWASGKIDEPAVFICSAIISTVKSIKNQLNILNIKTFTMDSYLYSRHKNEILEVFDCLADDFSKETYAQLIFSRIQNNEIPENIIRDNQYFELKQFRLRSDAEVFVDAGAYVGDIIENYLSIKSGVFKKIYAFEPDDRNYQAMIHRIERLRKEWAIEEDRIVPILAGVGEKRDILSISSQKSGSASPEANFCITSSLESDRVDIYSLDDYFSGIKVSFIKADIESFEFNMILGATQIIQRDKPLLAICMYHSASDMYSIPLLIKKILPQYTLSIRHHYSDHLETVLYAYLK